MAESIRKVKDKLKQTFFPEFSAYMIQVKDALEIMREELEETQEQVEEILNKIDEVEDMKKDVD